MNKGRGLFLLIVVIFLVLQTSIAREGAEDITRIESLNITETDTETLITLTATDKINYTLFKMDDPPRVTLDFGNANLDELKSSYSVENGIVKNIKVITEVEGGLPISRIEINMEKLMDFSATAEENKLFITVSKITPYKPPETQPELEQEAEGLEGEITAEPGAPEEGILPEGMGETFGPEAEIVSPEIGEPMEIGALPPPEGEAEIPTGAPLPEEGEETMAEEEVTEGGEIIDEGEPLIEEEPAVAEGALPAGEEIPEALPEVEAGAIAVAPAPPEEESPAEGETIEGIIEKEEKGAVIAQAPPPVEITPPPPPVPEREEKRAWIKGNKIVTSEKIRFNSNEAVLPEKYEPIVKEIAKILLEHPEIKIRIEGYTDSAGDDEFNRALSEYRAIWLKLLLERFGVPSNRIQVAGMGESNPIASNETEKGREKNRRVEFIIIHK